VVSNAGEHVGEVVLRIETGGAAAAGVGASEQIILTAKEG
jgi:hypothetical protein